MLDRSSVFRSTVGHLDLQDALREPVGALRGVTPAAAQALGALQIATVFDLAASAVFAQARAITFADDPGGATARFGIAPADWLDAGQQADTLDGLGRLPLAAMARLDPATAATLQQALGVETIADFAHWPPYVAARDLLAGAVGSTLSAEDRDTERLRPRFGEFPTERVYYDTLVMLEMQNEADPTPLVGPVSLKPAVAARKGFNKPAVGALLNFAQSWYAQGITLGHLLHSLALAPGESTRLAVIDWSRKTRASATEQISETEQLDNSTLHARAVSEIQDAVASELQQGGSSSRTTTTSQSSSEQGTIGAGGLAAAFGPSWDVSSASQSASTVGTAESSSWSSGNRAVTASMAQNVNDRTEQHATSVRNRRASAVREVAQSEHEEVSTRVVANYNHMHALTVQYYEVVQVYRVVVRLNRADRVLFIPMELLTFDGADAWDTVDRFRGALLAGALGRRARELLLDDTTSVAVMPAAEVKSPFLFPGLVKQLEVARIKALAGGALKAVTVADASAMTVSGVAAGGVEGPGAPAMRTMSATPVSAALKVWDAAQVAQISRVIGHGLLRPESNSLHFPDTAELTGVSFHGVVVRTVALGRPAGGGDDTKFTLLGDANRLTLPPGLRLVEFDEISIAKPDAAAKSGEMVLHLSHLGRPFDSPPIPIDLKEGVSLQRVVTLQNDRANRRRELLEHLRANQAHYSRAVFRRLDTATLISVLSQFTWGGRALVDQVEPKILDVIGNYLVLRAPIEDDELSGVHDGEAELTWARVLASRQLAGTKPDERLVPVATGGVFAEAVLGRSNSAEKLDITRFWNWQDSPIPLTATDIAPIATGSRGQPEDLKPGQLSAPVLNIVNPTSLPDPAGLGAALTAVASGNMFRDMSGLAGTQALLGQAVAGTLQAATSAGEIAGENMRAQMQKQVQAFAVAADLVKSLASTFMGGGGATGGGPNVGGLTGEGARINHGRDMDARGVPPSTGEGGTSPTIEGDGGESGGGDSSGPGGGSGGFPPARGSFEAMYADKGALGYSPAAFRDSTGDLFQNAALFTGGDDAMALAGGGGGKAPAQLAEITIIANFPDPWIAQGGGGRVAELAAMQANTWAPSITDFRALAGADTPGGANAVYEVSSFGEMLGAIMGLAKNGNGTPTRKAGSLKRVNVITHGNAGLIGMGGTVKTDKTVLITGSGGTANFMDGSIDSNAVAGLAASSLAAQIKTYFDPDGATMVIYACNSGTGTSVALLQDLKNAFGVTVRGFGQEVYFCPKIGTTILDRAYTALGGCNSPKQGFKHLAPNKP